MSEKKSNAEELKRMRTYYDKNWVKAIEIAKKLVKKEEADSLWSLAHSELLYCYAKNGNVDDVIRFGEVFLTKPIRAYNKLGVVEQLVNAYWTKERYVCICNLAKEAIQLLHSVVAEDLIFEEVQYYGEYYLHSSLTSKMTAYIMVAALMECDQEVVDLLKNDGMDLVEEAFDEPVIGEWICDSFNTLNFDEERCRMIGILTPQMYLDRFDLDKYSGVEVDDTVYDKTVEKEEWDLFMKRVEDVGFIDLRDCIIDFPKEYFEGEERDGFYIEPMMKNAWAGNLEVLYKVDILCQALDIPYFVNWGTMLGAVRHKGYIPWDDDLDIGVLRKDYEKLKFAIQYCQDELEFYDNYNEGDWGAHAAKITNAVDFILNREKIKRYHGFSFFSSIDVFVIDTVPRDKRLEKEQYDIICLIREVIHRRDEVKDVDPESAEYKKYKKVEQSQIATIQKLCQMEFEQECPSNQELFILSDEVMGLYPEAQSDYYTVPHRLANGQDYYIPKDVFSEMIRMPFEGIEVNVPVGYDFILRKNYGDDYMIPINRGGGHGYPFYNSVIESLVEDRSKKYTREETIEYIKKVSYGYYHDFLHQTNDTSYSFSEDYFMEETFEGKVVSEELKRIQAAELEIYAEIIRICEKKGIKCYALGDTINGAKEYQGFVPGIEGIHIGMKRSDYVNFFNCLCEELDTWFTHESIFLDEQHTDLRTYIMTDAYGVKDEDYVARFHGCTDIVAVDISSLDCVDLNKEVDEVRKNLVKALLRTAATLPDKGPYSDETYALIDEWTKGLEISIKKEGNLRQNVLRTVDAVASSYSGECDFYRVSPDLQVDMDVQYSCESLETAQEMKFGPCKILVPLED